MAILISLVSGDGDGALFSELVGVAHEVQQRLTQPHLVGMHHADGAVAMNRDPVTVLRRCRNPGARFQSSSSCTAAQ
jgi:hypothetical protein